MDSPHHRNMESESIKTQHRGIHATPSRSWRRFRPSKSRKILRSDSFVSYDGVCAPNVIKTLKTSLNPDVARASWSDGRRSGGCHRILNAAAPAIDGTMHPAGRPPSKVTDRWGRLSIGHIHAWQAQRPTLPNNARPNTHLGRQRVVRASRMPRH